MKVQTTTTVTTTNNASNVSIKMKNPEEFYIGKVKNKAKHNSMYLRGSMNRWGLDNKIIMNKNVASNGDVIWECEVFLDEGNHEFKFDVKNDWTISYGSISQASDVNFVGSIFQTKNYSEGYNNIKINITYPTKYIIRFNQTKMLCVVETVN